MLRLTRLNTSFMHIRSWFRLVVCCLAILACWYLVATRIDNGTVSAALTSQPHPQDAQGILKRFVDECVRITPGSDPFPKEFIFGPVDDRELSRLNSRLQDLSDFSVRVPRAGIPANPTT